MLPYLVDVRTMHCRKVYANLACQLMVAEVKSEEAWHARFEAGLASWRTLRTQHALGLYNDRLAGEWGEPESRLVIFRQLSQEQKIAYEVGLHTHTHVLVLVVRYVEHLPVECLAGQFCSVCGFECL